MLTKYVVDFWAKFASLPNTQVNELTIKQGRKLYMVYKVNKKSEDKIMCVVGVEVEEYNYKVLFFSN